MLNPMLNPNPLYTRTHCTYLDRHVNSEFNLSCAINNYILHRFTAFTHEIEYFIYYIRYPQGRQSAWKLTSATSRLVRSIEIVRIMRS